MSSQLTITLGHHSDKGRKDVNQDFHGACIPQEPQLSAKGIALAIADGISTSNVSRIASEAAVKTFLEDYYCTSPAWSVRQSGQRVIAAVNSWLYSQTRQSQYRYDQDRGYVCTLSAIVFKSTTAHVFHVGDARVYRLRDGILEQLTDDHRVWISQETSYLGRALGVNPQLEIDYCAVTLERGDVFVLATDGVHEFLQATSLAAAIEQDGRLDEVARVLTAQALERGSNDNLTIQLVKVEDLPEHASSEIQQQVTELPLPPELTARMVFDGYRIVRELHSSHRSHVHLATDTETDAKVVLKTPSIDLSDNREYLERFLLEDWIARRINNPHVVRACDQTRKRNFLYTVTEFIDGQTLSQWMLDHPKPSLQSVRSIVEQIARGLTAFHRLEMLHQDLRPENVMIDHTGTAKIVDFGSTRVAGIVETSQDDQLILGTVQYTAPEYFIGEPATTRSDLYSLGVIAYQMISGRLPYEADVPKARTKAAQRRLLYRSVLDDDREIPAWIDEVLRKATHPDPNHRYQELSEFVFDLQRPNEAYLKKTRQPLIERNPVAFWRGLSVVLLIVVVWLLAR